MTTSTFSVTGKVSWVDAGISLVNAVDSTGALAAMGASFDVKLEPIQVIGGLTVENRFAVVRSDDLNPLEVVGSKYCVLQNRDAAKICDAMVAAKEALYEAGSLMDSGRKMWILMRRPAKFNVVPGDTVESFVNVVNSHDGQSSLTIYPTSIRAGSNATLNVSVGHVGKAVRIRHTKGIANHQDLVKAIHVVREEFKLLEAAANKLVSKQLTQTQLDDFFKTICPKAFSATPVHRSVATKEDIMSYFTHGSRNQLPGVKGTAWALFNGIVEWIDYAAPTKGSSAKQSEQRTKSQLFGNNQKLKQKAFDLLINI